MNRPQSKTMPVTGPQLGCWSLEVVRGRVVGQLYALDPGETVVGNDLKGARGLDLVDQEGNSPRKMAGRHAALTSSGQELTIRDLDALGGTFVNQQRLLAGQARRLAPGDVIQLGSVQVQVK
jgi:pSer/pThr/pTyr-binding forkhead associated (FHA) protein